MCPRTRTFAFELADLLRLLRDRLVLLRHHTVDCGHRPWVSLHRRGWIDEGGGSVLLHVGESGLLLSAVLLVLLRGRSRGEYRAWSIQLVRLSS